MELNNSILASLFLAFLLSMSTTEATFNIAFGPASNAPTKSPFPINLHHHHHASLHFPCKTTFSSAHISFNLSFFLNAKAKLNRICAVTENPIKCVTLVAPCLSTSAQTTPIAALGGVILSLSGYVESALSTAVKLSKSKSLSSEAIIAINACIDIYVEVIEDLKKALVALKTGHIDAVGALLASSITNFGRCDEAFYQQGLTRNWPLKRVDQRLIELNGFGLDIYHKLILKLY